MVDFFYTFEMLGLSLNNLSKTWSYINILQVRPDKISYFIIKIYFSILFTGSI